MSISIESFTYAHKGSNVMWLEWIIIEIWVSEGDQVGVTR